MVNTLKALHCLTDASKILPQESHFIAGIALGILLDQANAVLSDRILEVLREKDSYAIEAFKDTIATLDKAYRGA